MLRLPPRAARRVSAVLGAVLVVGAAAAARPLATAATAAAMLDGVTFSYRVTSSRKDQKGAPPASFVSNVRLAGGNMRMDYVEGANPMAGKDGYIVIRGDDERLAIVSPKDKAVMVMDAAALGSGAGAALNNPMLKLAFKDAAFSYEDLGAGESVLGHRTHKYRLRQKYTMEMRIMGMRRSSTEESVTDQWVASDLKGVDERAMQRWAKSFGAGIKVTNPDMARAMERYLKDAKGGLALKSMVVSTHGDGKKTETDTTTMEVVELKNASHDASIFTWPDSYTVTDMGQLFTAVRDSMRVAGARTDSANAANGTAGADTAKGVDLKGEMKKEAIKAGIRGMLGRKKP